MKISLAGPSYTSASVVAAAQQTLNLIPEPIEEPNEPARLVLYGRPGLKHFVTLSPVQIRAMWAGGGRLFVIHGVNDSEVKENGTVTTSSKTVAFDSANMPDPAQIVSNGHQLMIVAGGNVYCDNGGTSWGPDPVMFQLAGTAHTIGTNQVIRDSGDNFTVAMQGGNITLDGHILLVSGFIDANHIIVTPNPPLLTDAPWNAPGGAALHAVTGCFLDGYGIVNGVPNPPAADDPGRRFYISDLNDFTVWNPLQFGVKEGRSDYIRSVQADHEELILLGTESTEIWTNVGATPDNLFPFQRVPGAFIQTGSAATYAPCSAGPSLCWIAGGPDGEPIAYQLQGMQPVRISTHAVENAWRSARMNVKDAVSYSYVENGHTFWVINFWQNQQTWVYDLTTRMWHERAGWIHSTATFQRYKAWYHVFLPEWDNGNGVHVVGDPVTGNLYTMSQDIFNDDGQKIITMRAMPHLINENQYAYHHRLEVLIEMGNLPGGATPPDMSLDWSDDHGHTFAHGRRVPMAQSGDYLKRAVFRRLGKSRDRVYRVGVEFDNCKVAFIDTFLEVTPGFA